MGAPPAVPGDPAVARARRRRRMRRAAPPPGASGPGPGSGTPPQPDQRFEFVNTVLGAGSLVGGLMFYAGVMHSSAYFGYFHVRASVLGFGFPQMIIWSLRLVTLPVLVCLALLALGPRLPELLVALRIPSRVTLRVRRAGRAVARQYALFVVAGVGLMLLWQHIQPYGWAAPLLVAAGLVLSQSGAANPARPARGLWRRGLPAAAAGLFLVWAIALVAGQLGRQDARAAAAHLVRRPAVVVLSTERLSLTGPGLTAETLPGMHYRYRYTGLRLILERDRRYYVLPVGWRHRTDPTFVIEDDDSILIQIMPGTQPREGDDEP
ncbi:hypothetical protein ADK86_21380 [Streptomyces sp. NRRL F-5755]|uniref:hypothetical protein n=1 Tax=Streptomyces sp. NRRL F-5755 TaxID=1519475 RepID=UPI0006ADDFFD|nr:hypothetical protein [Streptomyces sp. NRRL F-5755]KOT92105.1 hypothetical protein ADK86_21380 [Streptomyces sp. NRRL F-5755]